jgi:RHS repeat-associated protein
LNQKYQSLQWSPTQTYESLMFDRGYTGHEHLTEFGLINMNGRVYDPLVSRFLSPDPYIQAPGFTQSYNRYGYVFNNPLKYIDPTGYKSTYYRDWDYSGLTPPPCHGGYGWNFYYNYIAPPLGSGISNFAGNFGNPFSMGGGNWVNNFSGGRVRPPGFGINGPGFGGVYYDWYSSTYQSTIGQGQLHWRDAHDVLTAHHLNPGGITLPPITYIWSGRRSSGRIVGGVPKWWGDHQARYIMSGSNTKKVSFWSALLFAWDSKIIGRNFPDLISINFTLNSTAIAGASMTYSFNFVTRGNRFITITATEQERFGAEIDWGIGISFANYHEYPSNLTQLSLSGPMESISAGWVLSGQGYFGYDQTGRHVWTGLGFGIGLSGGASYGTGRTRIVWP